MKHRIRKISCIIAAIICVIGTTVTARADTINFNVTWPGDPYSYEVKKADSEQNFYVTTTSHYLSGFFLPSRSKSTMGQLFPIRLVSIFIRKQIQSAGEV